jgi:methyl-accepting chemotaxis protein
MTAKTNAAASTADAHDDDTHTRGLVDALHRVQAVIEFELDGTIVTANDNFLKAFGYSLDEVRGRHHRMFCDPQHVQSDDYRDFWMQLAMGQPVTGEFRRLAKGGREVWILASYNPVLDAAGKPVRVVKFATDITAEKARSAEQDGRIAAIGRAQAVIEFQLDGTVLTANDNFLAVTGYALDEIRGQHHRMFCDPSFVASPAYRKLWADLAEGRFVSGEFQRFGKHGKEVWINASYNPILDARGKPLKVVKFATDITAEKQRTSEQDGKIAAIGRAQAVIEFQLDGTILTANDNFLAVTGYTLDEIRGRHHRMFCDPEHVASGTYKAFWADLADGRFVSGEFQRFGKHGKEVWINASYNPILDARGRPFKVVKFATDITAEKQRTSEQDGKIAAISRAQAVIEFQLDGTILTANDNFLAVTGYTLDEIRGKHHRMFCEPEYVQSREYKEFWANLAAGEFTSAQYRRFGKNGKEVWISASYNPILDAKGRPFKVVKYATDISAQKAVERNVSRIAAEFVERAGAIAGQAQTVAAGAQSLGCTTEEINASVEELSASIDSIAQNSRMSDDIAKRTKTEADQGAKAIDRSIEAMDLINASSEEINEIVKVISEIASQTNLLAFNAAIEAARAGEHGLGFSVVADEVRKLAERSSQATKEITKLINETVKRVRQGSEVSREAGAAFTRILSGISDTTDSIAQISVAANEQQTAARDVAEAIQTIVDATEKSVVASDSIAAATEGLKAGAQGLTTEIRKLDA